MWEDDPGRHATIPRSRGREARRLPPHKEHQEQLLAALREAFPSGRDGINTHSMGNWLRRFDGRLTDGLKFAKEGIGHGGGPAGSSSDDTCPDR